LFDSNLRCCLYACIFEILAELLFSYGAAQVLLPQTYSLSFVCSLLDVTIKLLFILCPNSLGRSFGIAPANRGVVMRGPYVIVRHPIYTGYLLTHIAFLLAHPTPWNAAVLVVADSALVVRALIEERVLGADAEYQSYCRRVGWHLVPGVF